MVVASNPRRSERPLRPGRAAQGPGVALVVPSVSWYGWWKAALEWVFALGVLLLTAPLMLLAMILVKVTSPGPVLYSQTRVGRNGWPFAICKIRTMYYQCESLTGARWSTPGDKRVTPVGRWLRRTHLDELPQLWNILKGEMSLIGPRPERPEFVPQLEQAIPNYRARLLVRPGLSGLAQVQLPPDTDLASVRLKLAYDLYYIQHFSFRLELRIFVATALHVLGVPFRVIGKLLRFPTREAIEAGYRQLLPVAPVTKAASKSSHAHCQGSGAVPVTV